MAKGKSKVIADITIFPVGVGPSVGTYVSKAFKSMKRIKHLKFSPNAMATVIEADNFGDVMAAAKSAHKTLVNMGAKRVYIILRVDHRLDKPETAKYKIDRLMGKTAKKPKV